MTIPAERRRALRWASQALREIAADPGASAHLKAEVEALMETFPDDRTLATCFLERHEKSIPSMLTSIEAASLVLAVASRCLELGDDTRRMACTIARHFPHPVELRTAGAVFDARSWVDFHLLRDLDAKALQQELEALGIENLNEVIARFSRLEALRLPGRLGLDCRQHEAT